MQPPKANEGVPFPREQTNARRTPSARENEAHFKGKPAGVEMRIRAEAKAIAAMWRRAYRSLVRTGRR